MSSCPVAPHKIIEVVDPIIGLSNSIRSRALSLPIVGNLGDWQLSPEMKVCLEIVILLEVVCSLGLGQPTCNNWLIEEHTQKPLP